MYIHTYICIHTYTHTYVHTTTELNLALSVFAQRKSEGKVNHFHCLYIHTYAHKNIYFYSFKHTYTQTDMKSKGAHLNSYINMYMHTCMFIYIYQLNKLIVMGNVNRQTDSQQKRTPVECVKRFRTLAGFYAGFGRGQSLMAAEYTGAGGAEYIKRRLGRPVGRPRDTQSVNNDQKCKKKNIQQWESVKGALV